MRGAIDPNQTIADLLASRPEAARVFFAHRMHCVGCAIGPFETLAEACAVYGQSIDRLIEDLEAASVRRSDDDLLLGRLENGVWRL